MKSKRFLRLSVALAFALTACAGSNNRLKKGKTLEGEVVEAEGMAPYKADDLTGTKAMLRWPPLKRQPSSLLSAFM